MSNIDKEMKDFVDRVEIDLIKNYQARISEDLTDESAGFLVSALKRQIPRPVRVETYEYKANKYFCPECGKQQKQSYKNFKKGCFCERCGQKLLPLRS